MLILRDLDGYLISQLAALAVEHISRQAVASFAAIELAQDGPAPVLVIEVVQYVQRFLDSTQLGQRQNQLCRPVAKRKLHELPFHDRIEMKPNVKNRLNVACSIASLGIALGMSALGTGTIWADSKDGVFPTAAQVGGEVFAKTLGPGEKFPTDFEVYDINGNPVDLGKLVRGKKSIVVFFLSAIPVSVGELRNIQDFVDRESLGVQLLNINAGTVGVDLEGGPSKAIPATARTLQGIKKEHGITNPLLLAPNDVLSENGLSNRLHFRGLPTIFVVSPEGKIEKVFAGPQHWGKGDI